VTATGEKLLLSDRNRPELNPTCQILGAVYAVWPDRFRFHN